MSGLQIQYSKEVARELTKIAVCLPGAPVSVGDVIFFPFGQSGVWPFRKAAPRGAFNLISSLSRLGVTAESTGPEEDPDPYIFASRKTVEVDFDLAANTGAASASGTIKASFNKDGSVYFAAIDCATDQLEDLSQVQVDLGQHSKDIIWKDTFLVTSVTVAKRALIMQSSTSSASLEISGEVKGLVTGSAADISANANIAVKSFRQSSFIKPWSENVTVFVGLHRFRKEVFGYRPDTRVNRLSAFDDVELGSIAGELVSSDQDRFILEPVSALELLNDADLDTL
jgi:hypothetical protein